jgi:protein-S-isoprenylcysteine O-methyltransferase Ste14
MIRQGKPWIYVAVQLGAIAVLLVTGRWYARHLAGGMVQVAGLVLVLWAVATMGWRRLRIQPVVDHETRLVTTGPYRLVRHPMYTATLLASAPLVAQDFTWFRLVVWLLLAVCLREKSRYEETLLCAKFADYADYRRRVKQLIPWVY